MGEVYRARDTRLDRTVAVKILRSTNGRPERFHREARAISRLSHPHICSLYDIGEHEGIAFLVMEYLEGQTLADRLEEDPLPLKDALEYSIQICEALDRAHTQGVIHRDVKPGNVMLTREGVKLLDFGLAKLRESRADDPPRDTTESLLLTREGDTLGTILYMSPEQLEGGDVDARTDIFAVGAVLYEMLTGRRAFAAKSRASAAAAILTSDPPPISTFQPLTPATLEHVVQRCLAKNPNERWQTARDLTSELKWILNETPATGQAPRLETPRRSAALLTGVLLGAACVTAVSLGIWILRPHRPSVPSYQRLTYNRGSISAARFAPDGQTIIYSAAWQGQPYDTFLTRLDSFESRSLGMINSRILSVSPAADMAVLFGNQSFVSGFGTVARASLAGGLPRELLADATEADWLPDGTLAVVRRRENTMEVEFPVGTKVHEASSIWSMRVSPDGARIAFFQSAGPLDAVAGDLVVVDRSSRKTTLAKGLIALGLAWSPDNEEIWFTAARADGAPAIRAVSLSGAERLIDRVPAFLRIDDVSRDRRALVTKGLRLGGITCLIPGETRERDLGWLDSSLAEGLSPDGKTLLFGALEGRWNEGVYTRKTDGSPAIRLGDGHPESLSPDGKWVLARASGAPTVWGRQWLLLPTGPGSPRMLSGGAIAQLREGVWLPDGKQNDFTAFEEGRGARAYVQDVETGSMRSVTPEGVRMPEKAASPDGKSLLAFLDGKWFLYPLEPGEPRPMPFLTHRDDPRQWSTDGRFLYVARNGAAPPLQIERLNIATGERTPWKTLVPYDPVGIESLETVVITPDGTGYCYTYARRLTELYLVDGLK
jgi:serine/threonine protein kinase